MHAVSDLQLQWRLAGKKHEAGSMRRVVNSQLYVLPLLRSHRDAQ